MLRCTISKTLKEGTVTLCGKETKNILMLQQVHHRVTAGGQLTENTPGSHLTVFAHLWSFGGPALKETSATSAYVGRTALPVRFFNSLAALS
jgi:hypothetical protein